MELATNPPTLHTSETHGGIVFRGTLEKAVIRCVQKTDTAREMRVGSSGYYTPKTSRLEHLADKLGVARKYSQGFLEEL